MKLLYISNVKMPTNKAHGVHMIKMCEAFALAGLPVTFVVPMRFSEIKEDPYEYYKVRKNFKIKYVFSIDLINYLPVLGYWIQFITFSLFSASRYILWSRNETYIHTREYLIAFLFKSLGFKVTYEAHRIVSNKNLYFKLVSFVDAIITNSRGVATEFKERGFKKVLAVPNAVNLEDFNLSQSKEDLRKELKLSLNDKVIMYSGHLYPWKGIDTVVGASEYLKNENIKIFLMGGTDKDIRKYKRIINERKIPNVIFLGYVKNYLVPRYLKTADLLLLPNSRISEESVKYTSPMKMFEYMASGIPIVASDLPSLREVLNEETALFFKSDDPLDLSEKIKQLLNDDKLYKSIAEKSYKEAKKYTWEKRARKIALFAGYKT